MNGRGAWRSCEREMLTQKIESSYDNEVQGDGRKERQSNVQMEDAMN